MEADKIKWNERYQKSTMPEHPSDILMQYKHLLRPQTKALDIACGNGRNLKFLAQNQIHSIGIDIAENALKLIPNNPYIQIFCTDLDHYILPFCAYDIILNFYFLNRKILSQIPDALRKNGLVFLETFIEHSSYPTDIHPNKILQNDELESYFSNFDILHHQIKPIKRNTQGDLACVVSFVAKKS